ncbi:hypothetical protein QJS04_geneDACA005954 [Acorus gramineus]|uniref:Uncharacterized protein n=1 Tax=Acorus gramineus TaxID=55184 RepID=A0AAV9B312_ACOGR|nr:hypothetical protein QJS04_geneDACA005954 [Acorus gramineus]
MVNRVLKFVLYTGGKLEWPELVGAKVDVATATIERENPNVKAQPIPCNQYRIQDCCCNRVWLDYSPDGIVCKVPKVG